MSTSIIGAASSLTAPNPAQVQQESIKSTNFSNWIKSNIKDILIALRKSPTLSFRDTPKSENTSEPNNHSIHALSSKKELEEIFKKIPEGSTKKPQHATVVEFCSRTTMNSYNSNKNIQNTNFNSLTLNLLAFINSTSLNSTPTIEIDGQSYTLVANISKDPIPNTEPNINNQIIEFTFTPTPTKSNTQVKTLQAFLFAPYFDGIKLTAENLLACYTKFNAQASDALIVLSPMGIGRNSAFVALHELILKTNLSDNNLMKDETILKKTLIGNLQEIKQYFKKNGYPYFIHTDFQFQEIIKAAQIYLAQNSNCSNALTAEEPNDSKHIHFFNGNENEDLIKANTRFSKNKVTINDNNEIGFPNNNISTYESDNNMGCAFTALSSILQLEREPQMALYKKHIHFLLSFLNKKCEGGISETSINEINYMQPLGIPPLNFKSENIKDKIKVIQLLIEKLKLLSKTMTESHLNSIPYTIEELELLFNEENIQTILKGKFHSAIKSDSTDEQTKIIKNFFDVEKITNSNYKELIDFTRERLTNSIYIDHASLLAASQGLSPQFLKFYLESYFNLNDPEHPCENNVYRLLDSPNDINSLFNNDKDELHTKGSFIFIGSTGGETSGSQQHIFAVAYCIKAEFWIQFNEGRAVLFASNVDEFKSKVKKQSVAFCFNPNIH